MKLWSFIHRRSVRVSCVKVHEYSTKVQAEEKFKHKLKQGRLPYRHNAPSGRKVKNPTHDRFLAELWACSLEEVFPLLERSLEAEAEHDSLFQQAMQKFVDFGELQKAKKVFELMRQHDFRNHLAAWNMFFRICARLGQYEDAILGYEDMKGSKIKSNERCCTALIESYGMLKRLPELLQEFEDLDLCKDLVFYTQCVKECARIGDVVIAEKIHEELSRKKIQIDCVFVNEFLAVLKASGDVALSRKYFHLFDDKLKGGLNKDIFNRYLSIIQYEGNMEEVEWILEEMKAREVGIDDFTIFHLAHALAHAKDVDRVLALMESGIDVFRSLVVALAKTERLSELPIFVQTFKNHAQETDNFSSMFSVLHRERKYELMDAIFGELHSGVGESSILDFHNVTVGVAVARLRFEIKHMETGDTRRIVVGRGKHQRSAGSSNLKEALLKSTVLPHSNVISDPDPAYLILERT